MLQNIRDKTQGWITWVIVIVICFTFALWGINNYQGSGSGDKEVAEVNGTIITQKDFLTTYRNILAGLEQQLGKQFELNDQIEKELKQQSLQQLINYQIALQSAVNEKFQISNNDVYQVIAEVPVFQENGSFSQQRFVQALRMMQEDEQQYLQRVKGAMLIEQVRQGIVESSFVLPQELDFLLTLLEQKRNIEYIIIPLSHFSESPPNDEDVKQYYETYKENFKTDERVSLYYIELSKEEVAKQLNLSLTDEQVEKEFLVKSENLINISYEEPESLEPVAKATGLAIQETKEFTKNSRKKGIISDPNVIAAAFSNSVLNDGYNSDVITLENGNQVVVRVNQYTPQKIKSFEQAKVQVVKILEQNIKEEKVQNLSKQIVDQVKNKGNLREIAKENNLQWMQKENIGRTNKELEVNIVKKLFTLPLPTNKVASVDAIPLPSGDTMVVVLTRVESGEVSQLGKDGIETYRKQIAAANGLYDYDLYMTSLRNKAKIEIFNED